MHRWLAVALAALWAAGPLPAAQADKETMTMLQPEEFAILPWSWIPADREVLDGIRACGFNLAGFVAPEALDAVQAAGLKAIVSAAETNVGDAEAGLADDEVQRRVKALVGLVGQHPATFGYYLRDEPSAAVYPGLARWAAAYAGAHPAALAYINLFPNYASAAQMGVATYEEYLSRYVATVKPRFVSYDHYALMDDGSLRGGYFQNLEAVRRVALASGIPFWNIVLGNAHFHYAEPSPAGLRFQLYTTLAYGGRGISFFTYLTPDVGNYRLAALDQFGHRTPTWDMLRQVNLQLHRLGPTYLQLSSQNVFHHGQVPEGCRDLGSSQLLARLDGGNLLVGEFAGPGQREAVMVVNKDLARSTAFELEFKRPGHVTLVSPYSGAESAWAGEQCWLAPGQGMLLLRGQ
jgi:hypothetical protein